MRLEETHLHVGMEDDSLEINTQKNHNVANDSNATLYSNPHATVVRNIVN